ncbi:hypothetical protein [Tenacibaculum xiamenense]|uniref:hypothetical protein n=1 Tax=Tenacibaculum xiamenense TaxID=1261553 RepID=UPI00389429DB
MNRQISIIIFGSLFAFTLYRSYHYDNIFQLYIYLLLGIPLVFLFFKSIIEWIKSQKTNNGNLTNWKSLIIGVLVISINVGIYSYYEIKVNKPTLIKALIFGGYVDFKKNGEYVIISGSWASRTHFYGTFIIKDSIITVDRKGFDDVLTTNRFVIRNSNRLIKDNYKNNEVIIKKHLIQINGKGKEIKRKYSQENYRLPVVVDNLN